MYITVRGKVARRVVKTAIVIRGFRCPPETVPAEKIKSARNIMVVVPPIAAGIRGPVDSFDTNGCSEMLRTCTTRGQISSLRVGPFDLHQ